MGKNLITMTAGYQFQGCSSLVNFITPKTILSLGNYTLYYNFRLKNVALYNGMTTIGARSFYQCSLLTQIVVPNSVTSFSGNLFQHCHTITKITVPENLTSMSGYCFANCEALESIEIPEGITNLATYYIFQNCPGLYKMKYPSTITAIGGDAFKYSSGIIEHDFSLVISGVPTLSDTTSFYGINPLCKIKVPSALYATWIAATNWVTFADYIIGV